jgi:hypothetical protein
MSPAATSPASGGNITGVYHFATGLEAKRLGLLHEMVPKATTIAVQRPRGRLRPQQPERMRRIGVLHTCGKSHLW